MTACNLREQRGTRKQLLAASAASASVEFFHFLQPHAVARPQRSLPVRRARVRPPGAVPQLLRRAIRLARALLPVPERTSFGARALTLDRQRIRPPDRRLQRVTIYFDAQAQGYRTY